MGEIRFVGTGETRGYPYLVCKKTKSACLRQVLAYYRYISVHLPPLENEYMLA